MSDYKPVADVLAGITILPLDDGSTPLDAVVLVKALDGDGKAAWFCRYSPDLTTVEVLGALHAAVLLEEDQVRRVYSPMEDD